MSNQTKLMGRIGSWFRRGRVDREIPTDGNGHGTELAPLQATPQATRSSFLRPWARRDQAISNLQEGFRTLTDLMAAVRDNLDRQTQRQDELLGYLSHLPEAIEAIPEASRMQGETLKAIHQHLAGQSDQQERLVQILDKIRETGTAQRDSMDELREAVDGLGQADAKISDTLHGVGSAMQDVSRSSDASTAVLTNLKEDLEQRGSELERILHRQNTRFTTMLVVAIVLSGAALTAVAVMGYLIITHAP